MVHPIEPVRGVSIKAMPVSIVLPDLKGKSHLVNFMDTPGHVDFIDEVAAGLRIADGAVLVVDVIEGVMANTARIIRMLVREDVPFTLVVNKVFLHVVNIKGRSVDSGVEACS
jgi:U5 small nuclear ribonucleoprotein component